MMVSSAKRKWIALHKVSASRKKGMSILMITIRIPEHL
jgi:hypothetical protein